MAVARMKVKPQAPMKKTAKFAAIMLAVFMSVGVINYFGGWVTPDSVEAWLTAMQSRPWLLALAIVAVLSVDSLLSIPTIATGIIAGYMLGAVAGGATTAVGVLAAGSICYWSARLSGKVGFVSDDTLNEIRTTVGDVGPVPLIISRAAPMLPEVMSVLAGVGKMPAQKYYLYFGLGNVPVAFALAFAGSISTVDSPMPAVVAGLAPATLGAAVMAIRRKFRAVEI